MKKFIYQILMVLAIGAGFTACDSDDDYQPGAPTPANSMQVYFDADNTADYVCGPGEQPEMELKVSRVNDSEAAEVPIVCKSASEGLIIPSSVKFEAGQKTASLTIGVGEMEEDKKYSFDLALMRLTLITIAVSSRVLPILAVMHCRLPGKHTSRMQT